jgi:hypothetical protein
VSRFPSHTVADAPEASRVLLQRIAQSSPTEHPLNAHAQMAHSPAVLAAYTSLRTVIAEHGTLDPRTAWALNLAAAATVSNDYMIGIASRFARMNGWSETQINALRTGTTTGDHKVDALSGVIREAAANSGNVADVTWKAAQQSGWSDAQLAEAFAQLGLTVFTGYFLNYAQTEPDV